MAVAARSLRRPRVLRLVPARVELGAEHVLAGIVATSFVLRTLMGWLRAAPAYFPDEYIYAELGRSLAESGRPLIRGAAAHFPALLQPLLTAPAWLVGDTETGYRLVQATGALLMSLAAVPVFLLARRLGLTRGLALGTAALALALPELLYASWVVAEPVAYPLVLASIAAGTVALARPSPRSQLGFLALAALTTLARVQFVVLPLCFAVAIAVVGLRERRLRGALREQALALGLLLLLLVLGLAAGPSRLLGFYSAVLELDVDPAPLVRWAGVDALLLLYSSGWILAPGALLGAALALWRPRSRTELAFATLTVLVSAALLIEAGVPAANDDGSENTRYLFYVIPLAALCFGLYATRGWPLRVPHALLAGALLTVAARVPLAGYAADQGNAHAPFLYAVIRLERALGSAADASLVVAGAAAFLSLAAIAATSLRPRVGAAVALSLAAAACATASVGATAFDSSNTKNVRASFLPAEPSWVDRARLGEVTLLRNPLASRTSTLEQLFWNRSVAEVALMPGAESPDAFRTREVRVGAEGSLLLAGKPLRGPLLVDEYCTSTTLRGMRRVASGPAYSLWRPEGRPRIALQLVGRYFDGWLAPIGRLSVWPAAPGAGVAGTVTFTVSAPKEAGTVHLRFFALRRRVHEVEVVPERPMTVRLNACSNGPWRVAFASDSNGFLGSRFVSVRATRPVFTADPSVCAREKGRPLLDAVF